MLREVLASFGITWDGSALEHGNDQVTNAIGGLRAFAVALAGNELLGAIRGFAEGISAEASALQDASDQMGTTTAELQELQHAGVMAGLSTEATSRALSHLQQTSADAASGGRAQTATFRALGVQLRDSEGRVRPMADLMDDLAVNFGHIEDPARRAQLAQDLFGRSGARLENILHEGAGGLAEMRAEIALLGGGLLPEAIEAANAYDDAMDRNRVSMQAFRSVIAIELMPRLTELVTRGTRATVWLVSMFRNTNFLKTAMYTLGVVGGAAGARFLAGWLPTIVRFGGLALIVGGVALALEDLISLANGGPSAIGDFVNATYGMGTSIRLAQTLNEGWRGMIGYVTDLGGRIAYVFGEKVPASASKLVLPFTEAFRQIEGAWNSVWGRIGAPVTRVVGAIDRVAHTLTLGDLRDNISSSVASRITGAATNPGAGTVEARGSEVAGIFGRIARDVRDEYADIFNGRNGALAQAAPRTVNPSRGPRGDTTVHDNRVTHLNVSGVSDPHAAAREAVRLQAARERTQHDAAHPVRHEEDD